MNRLSTLLLAACAAALLFPLAASAQSFRCKNDLANVEDSKASVLSKCGAPLHQDSFCKKVEPAALPATPASGTVVNVLPCETVDEWTYNPGRGHFMTTLRFESGRLRAILYGDRVP
jgi:hypothetical protein